MNNFYRYFALKEVEHNSLPAHPLSMGCAHQYWYPSMLHSVFMSVSTPLGCDSFPDSVSNDLDNFEEYSSDIGRLFLYWEKQEKEQLHNGETWRTLLQSRDQGQHQQIMSIVYSHNMMWCNVMKMTL